MLRLKFEYIHSMLQFKKLMTDVVVHSYNPSTWEEERQKDQTFKDILSYAVSLRLVQGR